MRHSHVSSCCAWGLAWGGNQEVSVGVPLFLLLGSPTRHAWLSLGQYLLLSPPGFCLCPLPLPPAPPPALSRPLALPCPASGFGLGFSCSFLSPVSSFLLARSTPLLPRPRPESSPDEVIIAPLLDGLGPACHTLGMPG